MSRGRIRIVMSRGSLFKVKAKNISAFHNIEVSIQGRKGFNLQHYIFLYGIESKPYKLKLFYIFKSFQKFLFFLLNHLSSLT